MKRDHKSVCLNKIKANMRIKLIAAVLN